MPRPKKTQPGGYLDKSSGRRYHTKAAAKRESPEYVLAELEAMERQVRQRAGAFSKSVAARKQTTLKRNFEHAPDEALLAEYAWAARVLSEAADHIQNALFKRGLG